MFLIIYIIIYISLHTAWSQIGRMHTVTACTYVYMTAILQWVMIIGVPSCVYIQYSHSTHILLTTCTLWHASHYTTRTMSSMCSTHAPFTMQAMHMLDHVMLIDTMHITSYIYMYIYTTLHYYGPMHIQNSVRTTSAYWSRAAFLSTAHIMICYVMLFILGRPIEQRL